MTRILLAVNALIVVVFALLHLAGARTCVGFLSGTLGTTEDLLLGLAYVLAWFATVLLVPITTLAVILDVACGRLVQTWRSSRRP